MSQLAFFFYFFCNDTAPTEIYTLSLHDALPISRPHARARARMPAAHAGRRHPDPAEPVRDRKSTRLNSSHTIISHAAFCLKTERLHPDPARRGGEVRRRGPGLCAALRRAGDDLDLSQFFLRRRPPPDAAGPRFRPDAQ